MNNNYIDAYFKITKHEYKNFVGRMLPTSECELFSDCLKHTYYNDECGSEVTFYPQGTFEYVTQTVFSVNCTHSQYEELRDRFNQYCNQYITPDRLPISQSRLDNAWLKRREIDGKIEAFFKAKHKPLGNPWESNWERTAQLEALKLISDLHKSCASPLVENEQLISLGYSIAEFAEYGILLAENEKVKREMRAKIAHDWTCKYKHIGITFS